MEKYQPLRILSYASDFDIEKELLLRKNKYSTIFTGYWISPMRRGEAVSDVKYELFCNPVEELRVRNERILDHSIEIRDLSDRLPGIAKDAILKKVLVNEIQSTNEIEGVKSSRKEIRTVMRMEEGKSSRLFKIVEMYLKIMESEFQEIHLPEDVRKVYDALFAGSNTIEHEVDGALFRKDNVYVSKGMKKLHSGIYGEANITREIQNMIDLMNRKDVPFLIKACITHFILEYIHPFYDGNGRLGRYFLSSYLKKKLDIFSAICISYETNQMRTKYNKLFEEVSAYKNYGEVTHFVIGMMEIIEQGQRDIRDLLERSIQKLRYLDHKITEYTDLDPTAQNILYYYLQIYSFNEAEEIEDKTILSFYNTSGEKKLSNRRFREIMTELEEKGYLKPVKQRPIIHELTDRMKTDIE
ncbi:MAG: Fic family protein [Peptostreptococcaceae bacterium]|nr:Fic family protein [Peptostreptococcaceae bacterium]